MTPISLLDQAVDVTEAGVVGGQRLLEQQAAGGRLERVGRPAVDRGRRSVMTACRSSAPSSSARSTSHVWRKTRPSPLAPSMLSLR